jgi:hypothetical protein
MPENVLSERKLAEFAPEITRIPGNPHRSFPAMSIFTEIYPLRMGD